MELVPFDHGGFYPSDDGSAGSLYHVWVRKVD